MGTTTSIFPPDFFLHLLGGSIKSGAGFLWTIVTATWSQYWPYILGFFTIWVIYEVITRNGQMHYNSENGFSPTFNRVVGSGVYLLLQAIVYGCIHFFFGESAYTEPWAYMIHLVVFGSTKLLLLAVGFWVY